MWCATMAAHVQQHLLYLVFQASSDSSQSEFSRRRIAEFRRRRSRKKVVLVITMAAVLSMLASEPFAVSPRSIWMRPWSSRLWEDIVLANFKSRDWIENFRMSRDTFHYLCEQLRPHIEKQNTHLRKCISTERRVAITVWVLATISRV